jgi:hypothetical protein
VDGISGGFEDGLVVYCRDRGLFVWMFGVHGVNPGGLEGFGRLKGGALGRTK